MSPPFLALLLLFLFALRFSPLGAQWRPFPSWPWPWRSPQSAVVQQQEQLTTTAADGRDHWAGVYGENVARISDYHADCVRRCDDYFWLLSEWLAGTTAASGGGARPPHLSPNAPHQRNAKGAAECPAAAAPEAFARQPPNGDAAPSSQHYPLVLPILHGNYSAKNGSAGGHFEMHSSVTLVLDRQRAILVDTGAPLHRQAVLAGLLWHGVPPRRVDTVLITHPDAQSMGNLNLFPCAEIHSGSSVFRANQLRPQSAPSFENNRSDLPFRPLSPNSDLYLTPGISLQDQSLVVRNVPDHGTVAIVGKLILDEQDLARTNSALREFGVEEDSEHRKLWQATRREIVCIADYVVPGYGPPFRVSAELKRLAECDQRTKGG